MKSLIACPQCKSQLLEKGQTLECTKTECASTYPIVDGIPILVNERISTFNVSEYISKKHSASGTYSGFRKRARALMPRLTKNFVAHRNFDALKMSLTSEHENPVVLILGGAEAGAGMNDLLGDPHFRFLETDIVIGSRTMCVCDASYLPFVAEAFDAVIIQAVLEYILDPSQCVGEIYRVLKPNAWVYSEMPFMQDVHGGRYDFTRLTLLGHRRLYRRFSETLSGACAGPATALAWSIQQFFLSFVASRVLRDFVKLGAAVSLFWLKYFDLVLMKMPASLDGATGTYFLGRKSLQTLTDRDLIKQYRGAVPSSGII